MTRRLFLAVLLLCLLLGTGLRLSHLPTKTFGGDEVFSALRISGSSFARIRAELADGQPRPVAAWQAHLRPMPGSRTGDTVRALALEAPEHPPLFYVAARRWQQHFGSSNTSRRLLPALFSLILIPAMAGVAWELWHRPLASILAAALVALSPFHVLYAQELREYSLWASLIALSSWLLLRALRSNRKRQWLTYGIAITALLYCHLLSVGLVLSFALLPMLPVWRQRWRGLWLSSAAALLAYSPWLWAAAQGAMLRSGRNLWTAESLPLGLLSWNWGLNLSRLWIDLDPGGRLIPGDGVGSATGRLAVVIAGVIAVALALQLHLRAVDRRPVALMLALLAGSVLPLIAADLLLGGSRSAIARYPVAGYLAVQLAVAGGLTMLWMSHRRLSLAMAGLVLLLSAQSSLHALPAHTWWSKQGSIDHDSIAAVINRFERPMVVSEGYLPRLLSLSAGLRDEAQLVVRPAPPSWPPALLAPGQEPAPTVLLYRPGEAMLAHLNAASAQELVRTPSRYPYLPTVDAHTRQWLTVLHPNVEAAR